jgi:hypothetical protein
MSRWTDEELCELITLWPTNSASQIAKRLHRPRWAIRSKAKRLRLNGLRPHDPEHFDVRRPKRRQTQKPRRDLTDLPSPIGIATTRLGVGLSPDHAVTEQFARVVPARADIGGAEP